MSAPPSETGLSEVSNERVTEIIEGIRSAGRELGEWDLMKLSSAAYSNLMEQTNWELRQILTQIQNEVELGLHEGSDAEGLTRERAESVLGSVERATNVVDACLDRNEVTKRFIRLTPEPFDLGQAMRSYLEHNGFLAPEQRVRFHAEPAPVEGDRVRLIQALGHLFDRFWTVRRDAERVVGELGWRGEQIEGFVGLEPSHVSTDVLIDELSRPLVVEDLRFDIPMARAIVERHRGLVFVDEPTEDTVGFAFTLPALESDWTGGG